MIDWDAIKDRVGGSSASIRSIAKEFGVSHTSINKKIKSGEFKRYVPAVRVSTNSMEKKAHVKILGKIALRKIDEIKEELGEHYSPVDEPLIVVYAKAYERYLELETELSREDVISRSPKTLATYLNPKFNALQMTQKTLLTYANQLGLSMISRKNLNIKLGKKRGDQPSIFDFVADINLQIGDIDV
ncbi:MAG: P27 family phage terminase small subunit [Epsilonproteobacteria bacterium]|nr:P27 family phage terminase small subunit [Campylobacterota bacterium]